LDKYWCLICDKVRRADQESYDPCVHVAVFNVAVFDRGDENSLEAFRFDSTGRQKPESKIGESACLLWVTF